MLVSIIGQSLALIPSLPEMLAPVPQQAEALRATVTGVWIAAYALGCALGPILSMVLMGMTTGNLCRASDKPVRTRGSSASGMYQHCFDGFCTIFALARCTH